MSIRFGAALMVAAATMSACGSGSGSSASLETDAQKASYAIGLDMGGGLEPAADHVDLAALMRGIEDALAGRDPAVERAELEEVMTTFNAMIREEQMAERAAQSETNKAEGAAFLAENAAIEGVSTTESGLQYQVLREGEGPTPQTGQQVQVHYRGTLPDGTEFDSSYDGEPATFPLEGVIPGFTEALRLMNVGSHYRIVIPSELAYGAQGAGRDIGPDQTLVFEIELLGIQ